MSPKQFYKGLSNKEPGIMPMAPVPIVIGDQDIMAARLLLWMEEQMPDETTQGELQDVLDAAKWWTMFFASAHMAATHSEAP